MGSNARYRGSGGRILQKEGDWFEAGTKPLNQSEKGERGKPTIAERWALAKAGEYEQLPPENLKIYKYIHAMYRPVEDRDVLDNVGFVVLVAAEKVVGYVTLIQSFTLSQ